MAEWFKAHAWRACMGKLIQGSNPCLSAMFLTTTWLRYTTSLNPSKYQHVQQNSSNQKFSKK